MIKLVTELGKKVSDVTKDIGVTPTSVRRWVKQYSEHRCKCQAVLAKK
ncbi:MAG: transposase [Halanaerobiales bacterium]|nr:transposase [Halanaerobiales bacterium]